MLHEFEFRAPRTRAELLGVLADHGGLAKLMAGGTDVIVNLRAGGIKPRVVVDVKQVEGYGDLTWSDTDGLVIRPATTINDLLRMPGLRERFPLLVACAHDLASYQIRNRATVIGNIVNASPCADMAPALLCLDARAVIASQAGEHEVPMRTFITGVKRTVLLPGEVLDRVVVPASSAGARGGYAKLKRINGHDLGLVAVAVHKHGGELRVAVGSAAPTPVLVSGLKETDDAATVVAAARAAISPISDLRCTKEYREHMVGVYIRRLLREVA
jgi:CO/xanthine dehydrogenase FAD-binding subunit